MKIIVTGSLGNISKPLTEKLIANGQSVSVISSNPQRAKDIEALGASAAIGELQDVDFLIKTFTGADAVYAMVPPNFTATDSIEYYNTVGRSYVKAIRESGVKRVVLLSSYGAHLDKGTGLILGSHNVELMLNELSEVGITYIRAGYFYTNLYGFAGMIKGLGFIAANYGGDDKLIMVSPSDIADAVAEEIVTPSAGNKIRYVISEEHTATEAAHIVGAAIGKPELQWLTIPNHQMEDGLKQNGVPANIAALLVEMGGAIHSGVLQEDYELHKPTTTGKTTLEDFAKEFAAHF